jgi:chemotaxis protein CheZ
MSKTLLSEAEIRGLYNLIDSIYAALHDLRGEANGIAQNADIPDAALHLRDVLKTTEDATMTILNSANDIVSEVSSLKNAEKTQGVVMENIAKIIESCSFQDISGQRIKRVLRLIDDLQSQLIKLSQGNAASVVHAVESHKKKSEASLLNGPQLSAHAPSQSEVDNMFAKD